MISARNHIRKSWLCRKVGCGQVKCNPAHSVHTEMPPITMVARVQQRGPLHTTNLGFGILQWLGRTAHFVWQKMRCAWSKRVQSIHWLLDECLCSSMTLQRSWTFCTKNISFHPETISQAYPFYQGKSTSFLQWGTLSNVFTVYKRSKI